MSRNTENSKVRIANLYRNGLINYRKRHNISVNDWAKRAGIGESTLREFLNNKGTNIIQLDTLALLAEAEHCTISELIGEENPEILVRQYIGKDGELFELPPSEELNVKLSLRLGNDIEGAIIRSNDMFPVFREGQIIFYSKKNITNISKIKKYAQVNYNLPSSNDNFGEYLGKPALIELSNGRILLREIRRGSERLMYDLRRYNAPDMENVEIKAAYKIIFIKTDIADDF